MTTTTATATPVVAFPETPDLARIDSLIEWAAQHPEEHDQANYISDDALAIESPEHPCGTAYCLAGRLIRDDELAGLIHVDWYQGSVRPIDGTLFPPGKDLSRHELPMGPYAAARLGIRYTGEAFNHSGAFLGLFDGDATIETMRGVRDLIALHAGQTTKQ